MQPRAVYGSNRSASQRTNAWHSLWSENYHTRMLPISCHQPHGLCHGSWPRPASQNGRASTAECVANHLSIDLLARASRLTIDVIGAPVGHFGLTSGEESDGCGGDVHPLARAIASHW